MASLLLFSVATAAPAANLGMGRALRVRERRDAQTGETAATVTPFLTAR